MVLADKTFGQRKTFGGSPSSLYAIPSHEFAPVSGFQTSAQRTPQISPSERPGSRVQSSQQGSAASGTPSISYRAPQQGLSGTGSFDRPTITAGQSTFASRRPVSGFGSLQQSSNGAPSSIYKTPQQSFGSGSKATPTRTTLSNQRGSLASLNELSFQRKSGLKNGGPTTVYKLPAQEGQQIVTGTGGFTVGTGNGIAPDLSSAFGQTGLGGVASASTFSAGGILDSQGELTVEELSQIIPGGGVPGEDYSILSEVPDTEFSCEAQQFPGYYADTSPSSGCQIFHICHEQVEGDIKKDSFLCPIGSLFNQQTFVCEWWYDVDCSRSEDFYALNKQLGNGGIKGLSSTAQKTGLTHSENGFVSGFGGNGFGSGGSAGLGGGVGAGFGQGGSKFSADRVPGFSGSGYGTNGNGSGRPSSNGIKETAFSTVPDDSKGTFKGYNY